MWVAPILFCRCVDGCKEHALSQDSACPPVYTTIGELKQSYTVARKPPAPRPAAAAPVVPATTAVTEPPAPPAAGGAQ